MKTYLTSRPQDIVKKFQNLQCRVDVASILEIDESFLCKILYGTRERSKYTKFEINKKSSKKRLISAPTKNIAILQKKLNTILKLIYKPKHCVHGFVEGKGIVSNAKNHVKRYHIINIDIKDFFPTIHIGRIRGALKSQPYNVGHQAAVVISQICCENNGRLPQGGAASPILSNIICRQLDNNLIAFAKKNRCFYSRYADDITFSVFSPQLPNNLAKLKDDKLILSDALLALIKKNGFEINSDKTRHSSFVKRQEVTGVTVNEHPNIRRSYIRSVQGALYSWAKHGYNAASRQYIAKYQPLWNSGINLNNVLLGKIAFIKMVLGDDSPLFRKLAKEYNKLAEKKIKVKSIVNINPSPLYGSQPKKQIWNGWFNKYRDAIIFAETQNKNGTIGTATAFHIGKGIFATAGHVLKDKKLSLFLKENSYKIDNFTPYNETDIDVGLIRMDMDCFLKLPWPPTQLRLPEIGEEVAAIGYPCLPQRQPTIVMHVGVVEALPLTYNGKHKLIQVSFQSGGGLSGGCLLDRGGFVTGIMTENIFHMPTPEIPTRPYGQAVPIEYVSDKLATFGKHNDRQN